MGIRRKLALEATKMPTPMDIAWAAGYYEGEGNASNQVSKAAASCTQKDPETLYWLRDWFGGTVYVAGGVGTPQEKRCCIWRACGDRARLFLALIYPFLSSRRKGQVDRTGILDFLEGRSPAGMTYEEVGSLLNSQLPFCAKGDPLTAEKKSFQKAMNYRKRREDPAYVDKCREQSAAGNLRLRIQKQAESQPERIM